MIVYREIFYKKFSLYFVIYENCVLLSKFIKIKNERFFKIILFLAYFLYYFYFFLFFVLVNLIKHYDIADIVPLFVLATFCVLNLENYELYYIDEIKMSKITEFISYYIKKYSITYNIKIKETVKLFQKYEIAESLEGNYNELENKSEEEILKFIRNTIKNHFIRIS